MGVPGNVPPLSGHSPAPPLLPGSRSPLLHAAPGFFPRKALRKRTSVRSLGPLPATPGAVSCPPSPPAVSPWRLPSHVALQSSLACFLQKPDLTASPSPFPAWPLSFWVSRPFLRGRCRGLGHQLCSLKAVQPRFSHLPNGSPTLRLSPFSSLFLSTLFLSFPYSPILPP